MSRSDGSRQRRFTIVAAALALLLLICVALYVRTTVNHPGELGAKESYAVLQSVEYEHRSDSDLRSPLVMHGVGDSRLTVLGVPSGSPTNPRQWIILDQVTMKGDVMRIPVNADVHLPCAFVANLRTNEQVRPEVVRYLEGVCK